MALEVANFISELVPTNPVGATEKVNVLDDHIQLIKDVLQKQFPNITAAAINATIVEFNKLVGITGTLAQLESAQLYTSQQNFTIATLADGPNIAWDLVTQQVAQVTLAGNRTLDNPTNIVAGGTYLLFVIQDGTGSRTLTFASNYSFGDEGAPTLSLVAGKIDLISFAANPDANKMFGAVKLGY